MPSKTGNVLNYNAVDTPSFQIIHHTQKARAIIVHSCVSIIKILINKFDLRMVVQIIDRYLLLISNGIQFYIVAIFLRKAAHTVLQEQIYFLFLPEQTLCFFEPFIPPPGSIAADIGQSRPDS